MVIGHGPQSAEIMIVSDYPSKEELISRKALVGTIGSLIGSYIKQAGWDINKCFKTLYIKEALSLPRDKKKHAEVIQECRKRADIDFDNELAYEIKDIQPNVIIAVGELATRYLTGRSPVLKLRGSVLPMSDIVRLNSGEPSAFKHDIRVVPVLHPRDIQAKWIHNAYTPIDYSKAVRCRTETGPVKEHCLLWIAKDFNSLNNWWLERGRGAEFLTLDIETYMGFVTCIAFCHDGYEAVCVPFIGSGIDAVNLGMMWRLVAGILKSPVPKINQNIKYDQHVMDYWGMNVENIIGDTMLLSHCIYPELPRDLGFLTSLYTDMPYHKDEGKEFNPKHGWDTLYYYNAKDALVTWQIYKNQINDAREMGVLDLYEKQVIPAYHIYKKMDDTGIRIDETERTVLGTKYGEKLTFWESELRYQTGKPELNFNSPKQIQQIVYEDMKLPKQWKRNIKGEKTLTTDEETLEELILNHCKSEENRQILWSVIWCRKLAKILEYVETPCHLDGRMRTSSKLAGTKNGRTSMSETVDRLYYKNTKDHKWYRDDKKLGNFLSRELGRSFQTLPKHGFEIGTESIGKDIRRMYIPSNGSVFIEGDGGQAEARVVAVLAEDWEALDEMERVSFNRNSHGLKDDLHTKTAMLVKGLSFEEITEQIRQDFGKKPRHAGNYDMGAGRLSLMAHISLTEAQKALSNFHKGVPKVREVFHTTIRTLVTNTHTLVSPHGRVRQFFDKLVDKTYKEAFATIPQATVSDHTKFDTLLPLEEETREFATFLSESHDSLFFEVKKDYTERFNDRFKYWHELPILFEKGSFIRSRPLVIPLEISIGVENWYEMRKVK